MLQSPEPRSGQECHTFTVAVPQGRGKRNWVLDVEVYSKDGRGRKDQYSSRSGEWVAGRTWVSEGGGQGESGSPGKAEVGGRKPGQTPPATPPPPRAALRRWGPTEPQPPTNAALVCPSAAGPLESTFCSFFFFFSSDTLIWDVWQKKKPGPHACCPAKMKVQGLVQTITFLKSYLQKEKFP